MSEFAITSSLRHWLDLFLVPYRRGKGELKSCAATMGSGRRQAPTMRLNDRPADAKPHTGAVCFSRKERIEDILRHLRGEPYARITQRNKNLLALISLRLDGELSCSIDFLHRFDAIDEQIHHNLLQLQTISNDLRQIGCQLRSYRDVGSHWFCAQQGNRFLNT